MCKGTSLPGPSALVQEIVASPFSELSLGGGGQLWLCDHDTYFLLATISFLFPALFSHTPSDKQSGVGGDPLTRKGVTGPALTVNPVLSPGGG